MPLFPLQLVAYPQETVNLHIFEDRYKQLIRDVEEKDLTFGIPLYNNDKIAEYGTEMNLTQIFKVYESGEMDIQAQGVGIFRIKEFFNPMPDKLYAGGKVEMVDFSLGEDNILPEEILSLTENLYGVLGIAKPIDMSNSFELGHHIGFSVEQEYELLKIAEESDRQQIILSHLKRIIPLIKEMEKLKGKIRMNGHFKYFDPLKLQ